MHGIRDIDVIRWNQYLGLHIIRMIFTSLKFFLFWFLYGSILNDLSTSAEGDQSIEYLSWPGRTPFIHQSYVNLHCLTLLEGLLLIPTCTVFWSGPLDTIMILLYRVLI